MGLLWLVILGFLLHRLSSIKSLFQELNDQYRSLDTRLEQLNDKLQKLIFLEDIPVATSEQEAMPEQECENNPQNTVVATLSEQTVTIHDGTVYNSAINDHTVSESNSDDDSIGDSAADDIKVGNINKALLNGYYQPSHLKSEAVANVRQNVTSMDEVAPQVATETSHKQEEHFYQEKVGQNSFIAWLLHGNPVAKIGMLLLFFGLAYLTKISIDHNIFSIEVRLFGAVLLSLIILVIGWNLRNRSKLYSLILQGGGIGGIYITVSTASLYFELLPSNIAIVLLLSICAVSVVLASKQLEPSLAIMASIGGYFAPIIGYLWISNPTAMLWLYLLLSLGILTVSVWHSWKILNLVGFVFTFVLGVILNYYNYLLAPYGELQAFLVANILIFGILTIISVLHHRQRGGAFIDSSLLFGTPILGFAIQYSLVEQWQYGPAWSAFIFGLGYLILSAWLLIRYYPQSQLLNHRFFSCRFFNHSMFKPTSLLSEFNEKDIFKIKLLITAFAAIGTGFITLSIPLAFSAKWTASIWLLEGFGILWLAIMQHHRRLVYIGSLLMLGSIYKTADVYFRGIDHITFVLLFTLSTLILLLASWFLHSDQLRLNEYDNSNPKSNEAVAEHNKWLKEFHLFSLGFGCIGLSTWIWGITEGALRIGQAYLITNIKVLSLGLLFVSFSALLWRKIGEYRYWLFLLKAPLLLWPYAAVIFLIQALFPPYSPLSLGIWGLVWPLAITVMLRLLHYYDRYLWISKMMLVPFHLALLWGSLILIGMALLHYCNIMLLPAMAEIRCALFLVIFSTVVGICCFLGRYYIWPFSTYFSTYWFTGLTPIILLLMLGGMALNCSNGELLNNHYIPVLSIVDMSLLSVFIAITLWLKEATLYQCNEERKQQWQYYSLIFMIGFATVWFHGILFRTVAHYGELDWAFNALWHSRILQALLTLLWSLIALFMMLISTRKSWRELWFMGAGLWGVVILKLFVIDGANSGSLTRAFTFIGVAILMLVIGYFSPLPPKELIGSTANEKKPSIVQK